MQKIKINKIQEIVFILIVILITPLFLTIVKAGAPLPPEFTIVPVDNPDPVTVGNNVTFTATADDNKDTNWYLLICKTDITVGIPPTCDGGTYCVSGSTADVTEASCDWVSTGSGAQNWWGFPCDTTEGCGAFSTTNSPITVTAGDASPIVTLNSPEDNANFSSTIDFNCTASDDSNLVNVSLYGNWTGSWLLNDTDLSPGNNTPVIFSKTINEGYHVWSCQACDDATPTQCSFATPNRTFTVDSTGPTITLPVYTNATPKKSSDSLTINISVSDSGVGVDSCVVNVATATASNQTIPYSNGWCNGTYSLSGATDGNQTINVYANDTLNNWGLNDSYVVWIDNTGPSMNTQGSNETEITQNSYFCLNITAIDIPSGIDTVYAEVWNTTSWVNYTMFEDTTSCDGTASDGIYGVEIQGTPQGIWNYSKTYANDTLNNWNSYDFSDLTINVTTPPDTAYPQFSNFQENPTNNSDYSYGQGYQFNSTVTYTNGTVYLSFEGTNYSATNDTATNFYVDITSLSAENYNYYWWGYGNGTTNKYNSSSVRVYVVQKINPAASLMNNDSWTVTYPTTVKVNYSESNEGDGGVVYKVYRDGIDKGSGETVTLGYENYNYVLNTTGGTNYTANSSIDAKTLTVNQNTGACDILFNETSPKTYPVIFKVWTNCTSGFVLYRNGTGIDNNSVQNLAASSYNFTVIRNDTVNYSNYYDEKEFVVNKGTSEIATYIDNVRNNESVLLYSEKWLNATLITPGSGTIKLYYNDTLINQGASPLANLTNFTQEGEFNVSGIYDGNENYTSDIETWWVTVSTDSAPTVNIVYPENIIYNVNVSVLNYTADDDISLSHCWYSLNGGATNSSPDATCSNYTGLTSNEGSNNWTVWANDSINQIGSDIVFFTKDTTYPTFSNYLRNPDPPNEDEGVQVNVTITETNLDNVILEWNGTANYTVTTSSENEYYYTITSGNYTAHDSITYYWYANDTATNLNKSAQQDFIVANQIPNVSAPAINDITPQTNDLISCDDGDFTDDDEYDSEGGRGFKWYDDDVEISGQTSQTLDLSVADLDKGDVIKCSVRVNDSYNWSNWVNSSNTATIQNSPPVITNPLITVSWDANGSAFNYDYDYTDADGDGETWYDNTTLFDINSATGAISDTPIESEAGSYVIGINISDGEINTTDIFTYTINDVTYPSINFQPPTETNDSQLTRNYIQVNVTASDGKAIDTITVYLYNQTSLVNETTNPTSPYFVNFTNLPDENYYFNATVNDTSGNTNQTETKYVTIDTGPPTINYVFPTEDSGVDKNQNYIEINVTASDPKLDKIVIRLYNSSNIQINSSTTSSSPNFINFTSLNDGLYFYNATANDTFSNEADLATRNITLDTTKPNVQFVSLTTAQGNYSQNFISANVTASDNGVGLDTITIYLYNQTSLVNETTNLASPYFVNFTNLPDEEYYLNSTANDSVGNQNTTETRTIILDSTYPQIYYNPNTDANDSFVNRNWIFVNVTASDLTKDSVRLEWNGTLNETFDNSDGDLYWENKTGYQMELIVSMHG